MRNQVSQAPQASTGAPGNDQHLHPMVASRSVSGDIASTEVGALSAVAREESEIRAAAICAHARPRDEDNVYLRIQKACARPSFAEAATYRFPRAGKTIEDASVYLAREMARCWGNMRSGVRIVSEDATHVHIKGYALDLETNRFEEGEDKFAKLVQRKREQQDGTWRTEWVKPDERDLRELINRRGAILERNAILQVLPTDFVDDAVETAKKTRLLASKGKIDKDPKTAIRELVAGFDRLRVTPAMLTEFLGHSLDLTTPQEMAELFAIGASIRDGLAKREEYFNLNAGETEPEGDVSPGDSEAMKLRMREKLGQQPVKATADAPPKAADPPAKPKPTSPAKAQVVRPTDPDEADPTQPDAYLDALGESGDLFGAEA